MTICGNSHTPSLRSNIRACSAFATASVIAFPTRPFARQRKACLVLRNIERGSTHSGLPSQTPSIIPKITARVQLRGDKTHLVELPHLHTPTPSNHYPILYTLSYTLGSDPTPLSGRNLNPAERTESQLPIALVGGDGDGVREVDGTGVLARHRDFEETV